MDRNEGTEAREKKQGSKGEGIYDLTIRCKYKQISYDSIMYMLPFKCVIRVFHRINSYFIN
jgi:hypothetical protein